MQEKKKPSGIGTGVMKKGGSGGGAAGAPKKDKEEWGEW